MQTLMYVQPAFGVFLPFLFCHVKIFFHRQFDGLHLYFVLTSVADDLLSFWMPLGTVGIPGRYKSS